MVAFGRRRSISVVVAVAVAVSGRRRLPADLLSVAAGVPDLLRVLVLGGDPPGGGGSGGPPLAPVALTSKFLNNRFTWSCVAMRFQTVCC